MTRTRIVLLPTLALAALLQVGCNATTPVREAPAAPAPKPDEAALRHQRIAAEELSPHDRVTRALELFQSGHPKDAREHLSIALAQRPRYRLAKQLLDQFDVDPQKMLGKESFEYKVKPGESLSLIAER
jgi:hypothetical protein